MSTKHPRINLIVEKPLFDAISVLAKKNDMSLSSQVKFLVWEALETLEDVGLKQFSEERGKTLRKRSTMTHTQLWDKIGKKDL